MSFWQLSDGADLKGSKDLDKYEVSGGGNFDPIPDDTTCLAVIDEAKWDKDQSLNEYISLRWSIVSPAEYKNRKVFQKLWVEDLDPNAKEKGLKKRDNAKKMLASIDFHTGGKLLSVDERPTDERMASSLMMKPLLIKLKIWGMGDKKGNWIAAVTSKDKGTVSKAPEPVDDEIPF
jgi:hypothetical protein